MAEACPKKFMQLYKGMIRIFANHTAVAVAGLELQHKFVLCGIRVIEGLSGQSDVTS